MINKHKIKMPSDEIIFDVAELFKVFGDDLRNLLGGHAEIAGHLPNSILD